MFGQGKRYLFCSEFLHAKNLRHQLNPFRDIHDHRIITLHTTGFDNVAFEVCEIIYTYIHYIIYNVYIIYNI